MNIIEALEKGKRIPLIGNFELTRKCPFNCLICYNERKDKRELNTDEVLSILRQIADAGCVHINFTGGDPLIRSDFPKIYKSAVDLGLFPSVESELVYLSADVKNVLCEYPPHAFSVSVYATDDEVLHAVTRSNFSAHQILDHVTELVEANVPVRIRTPLTTLNINQAGKIARFCRKLGIPYNPTTKIFWTQDGVRRDFYRCSPNCVKENSDGDQIYDYLYELTSKLCNAPVVKHTCDTGISDFNISAYGEINYCITFWKPEYDLLTGSFQDAWENWYPHFRRPEENYCLGKTLWGDGKTCPWGYLYSHPEIDTSKSLLVHAKEKICSLEQSGFTQDEICIKLGIDDRALQIIMDNA